MSKLLVGPAGRSALLIFVVEGAWICRLKEKAQPLRAYRFEGTWRRHELGKKTATLDDAHLVDGSAMPADARKAFDGFIPVIASQYPDTGIPNERRTLSPDGRWEYRYVEEW